MMPPLLRSLMDRLIGGKKTQAQTVRYELVNSSSASFQPWNGNIYENDIARSAIWAKAEAAGKVRFVHARGEGDQMRLHPDPSIRAMLEYPNEHMTMQELVNKLYVQREIYNNAFALIVRNDRGKPVSIYPINFASIELLEDRSGQVFCKFLFRRAKPLVVPYADIIHLRKHFNDHDFFGDSNLNALKNIMEVIDTTDTGMVTAVKNSAVISWLLKFTQVLKPDDIKARVKEFSEQYLSTANNGWGVMPTDPRYDAQQVEQRSYVPNAAQMDRSKDRLLMHYGVSEKIIKGDFTETEWNSFYESQIEPFVMLLARQLTLKCFTAHERSFMNRIYPESTAMQYASHSTKLALVSMVDRGALTPNEWRAIMSMGPIEGGDEAIRRLDTQTVASQDEDVKPPREEQPDADPLPPSPEGEEMNQEERHRKPAIEKRDRVFEVRSLDEESSTMVEGRALVFDAPTVMFEMDGIQYKEVIARGALDGADMGDVPMRYNHSESVMIVARHNAARPNRSTMELVVDNTGLLVRADIGKTASGRDLHEAIREGLVDKMSFAFTIAPDGETYDQTTHTRTITKIKRLWDVSAVDTPAYDTTSIYARDRFKAEAEAEKSHAEARQRAKQATFGIIDTILAQYEEKEE